MNSVNKTNALKFRPKIEAIRPGWRARLENVARRCKCHALRRQVDDYDWTTYDQFYGPENEAEAQFYTYDLSEVDFEILSGRIFTVADAKPINPWNRVLLETIINLPQVTSVHEIGSGGGKLVVNLAKLLSSRVVHGASDIGLGQLSLFARNWPEEYRVLAPFVHDITASPLPEAARADVVFTATVLMHIKRPDAYRAALGNMMLSARRYVVILENWATHDYVEDLNEVMRAGLGRTDFGLFCYDSGAAMALVASLDGQDLPGCYQRVEQTTELRRYS
jgi:hypothetical protein